ncbi:ATPase_ Ca++ transporting_ plasma membrane 3, partial [Caligus rogercresseyi]
IRVVNAFRTGMDSTHLQQASSNPNIQRVLQKQASLNKTRNAAASVLTGDANAAAATPGSSLASTRIKMNEHSSHSHTETAV